MGNIKIQIIQLTRIYTKRNLDRLDYRFHMTKNIEN